MKSSPHRSGGEWERLLPPLAAEGSMLFSFPRKSGHAFRLVLSSSHDCPAADTNLGRCWNLIWSRPGDGGPRHGRVHESQICPNGHPSISSQCPLSGYCKTRKYRWNKILAKMNSSPILGRDALSEGIGRPSNESIQIDEVPPAPRNYGRFSGR